MLLCLDLTGLVQYRPSAPVHRQIKNMTPSHHWSHAGEILVKDPVKWNAPAWMHRHTIALNQPQKNRKTVFKFYLLKGQPLYDFFENGNAGGGQKLYPLIRKRPDCPNRPGKMVINDAKNQNHNTPHGRFRQSGFSGRADRTTRLCAEKI